MLIPFRRNVSTFPKGLIHDEGVLGAMKIIGNALKPENRETFNKMYKLFNDPTKS